MYVATQFTAHNTHANTRAHSTRKRKSVSQTHKWDNGKCDGWWTSGGCKDVGRWLLVWAELFNSGSNSFWLRYIFHRISLYYELWKFCYKKQHKADSETTNKTPKLNYPIFASFFTSSYSLLVRYFKNVKLKHLHNELYLCLRKLCHRLTVRWIESVGCCWLTFIIMMSE